MSPKNISNKLNAHSKNYPQSDNLWSEWNANQEREEATEEHQRPHSESRDGYYPSGLMDCYNG